MGVSPRPLNSKCCSSAIGAEANFRHSSLVDWKKHVMTCSSILRLAWAAVALGTILSVSTASAADMPLKAPSPPVATTTWTGWYGGLNIGGAWDASTSAGFALGPPGFATALAPTNTFPNSLSPDPRGVIGGGQIGYNWQMAQWLVGLEADVQASGYRGTASVFPQSTTGFNFNTTVSQSISWFGTLRPRAGLLVTPNLLFYGTGGLAFGEAKVSFSTQSLNTTCFLVGVTCIAGSSSATRAGWAAGAGLEYMFSSHWTARIEYLYVDLGSQSDTEFEGFAPTIAVCMVQRGGNCSNTATATFRENIGRFAINYKF
jgi:outer membrane immunogenic protein